MDIAGKVVVVTGGADGIGKALCERFHRDGAQKIVVVDRNGDGAKQVAASVGGVAFTADVGHEEDIVRVVTATERDLGPIALFCSNAGIGDFGGDPENATASSNAQWQRGWDVNVMAHVYAARACLPAMIARGQGYFLNTVSAAGLLNQIGSAVYGTTKHAAIGFAENLAFTHRDHGIRVSVLCPQGVDTALLRASGHGPQHLDGVLSPDAIGDFVMQALRDETFLVLPHPQVLGYMRNKTENYDRWLGGMAKLRRMLKAGVA